MILCAAGDIHGAIDQLYRDVLFFEDALDVRFACVLHVGDFGVWPDPSRIDKATKSHDGAGDFATWLSEDRAAPRQTVFIKGNHEDFEWLEQRRAEGRREALRGLTYLPSGEVIDVEGSGEAVRVGGIGGCHGPSDYEARASDLRGARRRHFTRDEVEQQCAEGFVDVLLLHDAPAGVEFTWRRDDGSVRRQYASEADGLAACIAAVRPTVCFFGHHHTRLDAEVAGVRCIGLNKVGHPGNLVAIDLHSGSGAFSILGEWPPSK